MPTKNPRILVTLDPILYQWIQKKAEKQGVSMSLVLRDLVKKDHVNEKWYWSEYWQKMEAQAEKDLETGNYKDFENIDSLLCDLNT